MSFLSQIFILALLCLSNISIADDSSAATHLIEKLKAIKTLQADFVQESYDAKQKLLQKQNGSFKVKDSGEFIWLIAVPYEQKIISDAKSLKIYDPDLEQLTIKKLDDKAQVIPLLLFSGKSDQINDLYNVVAISDSHYSLASKSNNNLFDKLEIDFVDETPVSLIILDSLKQKTIVSFSNTVFNKPLSASLFQFIAPEGADIVDER